MTSTYKKFSRILIVFSILFVFGGCAYNEDPLPSIVHDYNKDAALPSITPVKPVDTVTDRVPAAWFPSQYQENKSKWHGIIIHHSATSYGNAAYIDKLHKANGWDGIGYHFVINNGVFKKGYGNRDGVVEVGYRWPQQKDGSHCRLKGDLGNYWNKHTIGICLIGNFEKTHPTKRQWRSLVELIRFLQKRYNIPTSQIKGHRQIKPTACPGKNFSLFRLKSELSRH